MQHTLPLPLPRGITSGSCVADKDQIPDELDEQEKHDLDYWRPQRIGDVVFNHWD